MGCRFISMYLVILVCASVLQAQNRGDNTRGSRGKEFWLTFLPNFHGGVNINESSLNDSLYIFITCDKATSGRIIYRDRNRQQFVQNFQISDPNQMYMFSLRYQNFEIEGINNGERFNQNSQNESIAAQSFYISANDDVTVYGLNQARFTSDAFLAIPLQSLGKEYMVMAYNSDGNGASFSLSNPGRSTPSQFGVIATENDTEVHITPSVPTLNNSTAGTRAILLNRGDVYLVQADMRVQAGLGDLTGSKIISNKPIAVFGSHQRTTLPVRLRDRLNSRDHLVEQLPGIETWGKQAFITPYSRPRNAVNLGNDLYRVLAAFDGTVIFFNGNRLTTLRSGEYYEAPLTEAGWITASDQILVAQYKQTANPVNTSGVLTNIGDPFMMISPAVEQYDNSYRFINVQAFDPTLTQVAGGLIFEDHFVTIVTSVQATNKIFIDNTLVPSQAFQPIGNSGYAFANIQVQSGVHTARSDSVFGLYVYGYGLANSYGYIGGGKLRIIAPDRDKPVISGTQDCFRFSGVVVDTLVTDSRLAFVRVEPTTFANVRVEIPTFRTFADSIRFNAELVDRYQDGTFVISAQDSIGFLTQRIFTIYGFTVGLEGHVLNPQAPVRSYSIGTDRSRSFPVALVNYGATTQTLSRIEFRSRDSLFFIQESLPRTLAPGERDTIYIRWKGAPDGFYRDTLVIGGDCTSRSVIALAVSVGQDNNPPTYITERNECERTQYFEFRDSGQFSSGIQSVVATELVNCTIHIHSFSRSDSLRAILSIQDPKRDTFFTILVSDSTGNIRTIRDTIPGFTLVLVNRDTVGSFGEQSITFMPCRTLQYRNTGVKTIVIPHLTPQQNTYFSIPPSQTSLLVPPGETRSIQVCFSPLENKHYSDTLFAEGFCTSDTLILTGSGKPSIALGTTRCEINVQLTTAAAPRHYFMEQNFPNPSSQLTSILVGLAQESLISLAVYSVLGERIAALPAAKLSAGIIEIRLDVSQLQPGLYFYEMIFSRSNSQQRFSRQMWIIR